MTHRYAVYHSSTGLVGTVGFINKSHPHWDVVSIQECSINKTLVVHRVLVKEEEPHRFATVTWSLSDIETLRPEWSEDQCVAFLKANERRVVDLLIPRGWEILEELLSELEIPEDGC